MTIKDIARLSGYAVGTVSRVLNGSPNVSDEARAKVMAVVQEHHFTLNNNAKHLKQQHGNTILVICSTALLLILRLLQVRLLIFCLM